MATEFRHRLIVMAVLMIGLSTASAAAQQSTDAFEYAGVRLGMSAAEARQALVAHFGRATHIETQAFYLTHRLIARQGDCSGAVAPEHCLQVTVIVSDADRVVEHIQVNLYLNAWAHPQLTPVAKEFEASIFKQFGRPMENNSRNWVWTRPPPVWCTPAPSPASGCDRAKPWASYEPASDELGVASLEIYKGGGG